MYFFVEGITELNFNSVPGAGIKTYEGAYPIPSSNHLCSMHNWLRDVLHDLAPLVPFKEREKHPWRSITFNKVAG